MTDLLQKSIAATPQQAMKIFAATGVGQALMELERLFKSHGSAPGLALAVHAIRAMEAEKRVEIASIALRAAAKGGIDINAYTGIYTHPQKDGTVLFLVKDEGERT